MYDISCSKYLVWEISHVLVQVNFFVLLPLIAHQYIHNFFYIVIIMIVFR
jgi:hypothetical protein